MEENNVDCLVILSSKKKDKRQIYKFWYKKMITHGIKKTLNRFLYQKYIQNSNINKETEKNYFNSSIKYKKECNTIHTDDINSEAVSKFLEKHSPDLIAVCGSNVIKPKIFNIPKIGTINIHAGITPDYRCAHPVEWAIYNKDFQKVGTTIHYVNEGIDTGAVILQETTDIERGDNIESIYCRNIINGAKLMNYAIKNIYAGKTNSQQQDIKKGKKYLSMDFGYLQYHKVNKILKNYYNRK
jgi:methionyl-tRNA formyltransferase